MISRFADVQYRYLWLQSQLCTAASTSFLRRQGEGGRSLPNSNQQMKKKPSSIGEVKGSAYKDEAVALRERILVLEEAALVSAQKLAEAEVQATSALKEAADSRKAHQVQLAASKEDALKWQAASKHDALKWQAALVGEYNRGRASALLETADQALIYQRKVLAAEELAKQLRAEVGNLRTSLAAKKEKSKKHKQELRIIAEERDGLLRQAESVEEWKTATAAAENRLRLADGEKEKLQKAKAKLCDWLLESNREKLRLKRDVEIHEEKLAQKKVKSKKRKQEVKTLTEERDNQAELVEKWKTATAAAEECMRSTDSDIGKLEASSAQLCERLKQSNHERMCLAQEVQAFKETSFVTPENVAMDRKVKMKDSSKLDLRQKEGNFVDSKRNLMELPPNKLGALQAMT
eukprot:TRINITY_DN467_c0_g2_i1.p1 TRINITY_DN467_c0_g2~~TRINITY_DN467_c0_g2_i1.p1  ORF type:complete len:406 (+),score=122.86 TRINITY_DN467_c0_g2_i1:159-1376(+)